jgi:hypothetical protein
MLGDLMFRERFYAVRAVGGGAQVVRVPISPHPFGGELIVPLAPEAGRGYPLGILEELPVPLRISCQTTRNQRRSRKMKQFCVCLIALIALTFSIVGAAGKTDEAAVRKAVQDYHESHNFLPGASVEVKSVMVREKWACALYDLSNLEMGTLKPGRAVLAKKQGVWKVLRMSTSPLTSKELKTLGVPSKYHKEFIGGTAGR